jgi:hypothetical protein
MREAEDTIEFIWLEVSNVALDSREAEKGPSSIEIQLKGDADSERWFQFHGKVDDFKPLVEAMKDKRPIYAKFGTKGEDPKKPCGVTGIRIAFSTGLTRN